MHSLIDGSIHVLYKCFPVIPRGLDTSLSVTICPRATNAYIRYIGITATTEHGGHDMASEIALVLAAGTRFYKGRYCGSAWRAVLQTAGEYRLLAATADKLNVSHSFVSKSDRKQAAGCHLASLSYPVSLPAGISF